MNFYTDGLNGSNAQLTLTGTNTSGSSKTANITMQQPTGLIIQGGTGTPIQLWVNSNVVAQTIAIDGSITIPGAITTGSITTTGAIDCSSFSSTKSFSTTRHWLVEILAYHCNLLCTSNLLTPAGAG